MDAVLRRHGGGRSRRCDDRARGRFRDIIRHDLRGRRLLQDGRVLLQRRVPRGVRSDGGDGHHGVARLPVGRLLMGGDGRAVRSGRRVRGGAGVLSRRDRAGGDAGPPLRCDDVQRGFVEHRELRCRLLLRGGVRGDMVRDRDRPCQHPLRRRIRIPEVRHRLHRHGKGRVHRRGDRGARLGFRVHQRLQLRVVHPSHRRRLDLRRDHDRVHLQDPALRGSRREQRQRDVHRRRPVLGGEPRGGRAEGLRGRQHLRLGILVHGLRLRGHLRDPFQRHGLLLRHRPEPHMVPDAGREHIPGRPHRLRRVPLHRRARRASLRS